MRSINGWRHFERRVDGDQFLLDAKVLWFEQFPELVEIRASIRDAADANSITFVFSEDSNYF